MADPRCECGAEIRWITLLTDDGGRPHPVDFEPVELPVIGLIAVRRRELEGLVGLVLTQERAKRRMAELLEKGAQFYRSHFETCPLAERHRGVSRQQTALDV